MTTAARTAAIRINARAGVVIAMAAFLGVVAFFGCAFVGMLAGFLPKASGRREIVMLALYGSVSGYLFGFLLNLSFWPFSLDPNSSLAYLPGLPFTEQFQRYLAFDLATSLGWDTGRAVTNFICITLAGPAVLTAFRRAARKARFQAPVHFRPGARP